MKQLSYIIRYLLKGRGNSSIKIISLTLGLVISMVLYTRIAFEVSYDNFYPEKEYIYKIRHGSYTSKSQSPKEDLPIYAPMPACMKADVQEVANATLTGNGKGENGVEEMTFRVNDQKFTENSLTVDGNFISVFSLPVLSGDAGKMSLPYQAFLSRSVAQKMFGKKDPTGEIVQYVQSGYKQIPITVAGVFEDIPENSSFDLDILLSIQTLFTEWGQEPKWGENDNYRGYVKLHPNTTPEEAEAHIPAALAKNFKVEKEKSDYFLHPITTLHMANPDVKKTLLILGILASSLLLVSAMNYVLISVSSLVKRGKQVGVLKTCGASNGNIFMQFLMETIILVIISLFLSGILILACKGLIEELIHTSVFALFSMHNLWVTGLLVVTLVLIAGVIPAGLFAVTPATQVFRSISSNKRYWKNILLFIQFVSVTCMSCTLYIVIRQYDTMINKDWGYSMENLMYADLGGVPKEQMGVIKAEFSRIPAVEKVTLCTNIPLFGMNGDGIVNPETKENMFPYKLMGADKDFLETFGIQLKSGINFIKDGENEEEVIVSETFIRQLDTHQYPRDQYFQNIDGKRRIVGVVKDFQLLNLYSESLPLLISSVNPSKGVWWGTRTFLVVKAEKRSLQLLQTLNSKLLSLTNNNNLEFKSYKNVWELEYTEARLFRNTVILSAIIMLLITLLGLVGYVDDEIFRRQKEIAIRKINGATGKNILYILSKDFGTIVVPAILLGSLISYSFGSSWLQQFVAQIPLSVTLFITASGLVVSLLFLCICFRSWKVVHENPVKNLKTE